MVCFTEKTDTEQRQWHPKQNRPLAKMGSTLPQLAMQKFLRLGARQRRHLIGDVTGTSPRD
jgi:hypothetical protein